MSQKRSPINLYFWLLIIVSFSLTSLGLAWAQVVWHACQARLQDLPEHLPLVWQLIIPTILGLMAIRGGLSLVQQLRATLRMTRLFFPLREAPPAQVQALLSAHRLLEEDIVFLNLPVAHAFCLGFWRPRIWLTAGLVNLLTEEELAAVLAHEVYHCHQHDPLRLLIGRTLKSAFFFLPLVGGLAQAAELQQEVAADQSAIGHLGDDLPLLCTLQKLLKQSAGRSVFPMAAYSPFNVTEARLRRLIYPPQPFNWRICLASGVVNLSALVILSSIVLLSSQPVVEGKQIGHCGVEPASSLQSYPPSSDHSGL